MCQSKFAPVNEVVDFLIISNCTKIGILMEGQTEAKNLSEEFDIGHIAQFIVIIETDINQASSYISQPIGLKYQY